MGKEANNTSENSARVIKTDVSDGSIYYEAKMVLDGKEVSVNLNLKVGSKSENKDAGVTVNAIADVGDAGITYSAAAHKEYYSIKTPQRDATAFNGLDVAPGDWVASIFEGSNRRDVAYQAPGVVAKVEKAMLGGETPNLLTETEFREILNTFKAIDQSPNGIAPAPRGAPVPRTK